jgi:hypothetical protein
MKRSAAGCSQNTPRLHFLSAHCHNFFLWGDSLPASHAITHLTPIKKKHAKKTQPASRSRYILYLMSYMKANGFERVRLFLLHVFLLVKNTGMDTQISAIPTKKGWLSGKLPISLQKIHSFHVFPVCRN